MPNSFGRSHKTECVLSGERVRYDMCKNNEDNNMDPVEWVSLYNKSTNGTKYEFIGSSFTMWCDDKICHLASLYHFFKVIH